MRKPRALRPGDRVAVVAPASPFRRDEFDAGLAELRALGFDPIYEESVFARHGYVAGAPAVRAAAFLRAWEDPTVAALVAARGGYGSVQLLPLLDRETIGREAIGRHAKAFIGYSDNTSLLSWLTLQCGVVSFHGPMMEGRLARGEAGYDRDTFVRCLCRPEAPGEIAHPQLETIAPGEASGMLLGGTLTQLTASMGTPFAFDPPPGFILFVDEVGERPFRIDRMLTQLRLSGILARASAVVFGELPRCEEPDGNLTARSMIAGVMEGFRGPVLFGLPSGHSSGATLTLPLGVRARAIADTRPRLVIEEAAVS
jgi:muramoyltetrapeptide carboxypeptidase